MLVTNKRNQKTKIGSSLFIIFQLKFVDSQGGGCSTSVGHIRGETNELFLDDADWYEYTLQIK